MPSTRGKLCTWYRVQAPSDCTCATLYLFVCVPVGFHKLRTIKDYEPCRAAAQAGQDTTPAPRGIQSRTDTRLVPNNRISGSAQQYARFSYNWPQKTTRAVVPGISRLDVCRYTRGAIDASSHVWNHSAPVFENRFNRRGNYCSSLRTVVAMPMTTEWWKLNESCARTPRVPNWKVNG